MVFIESIADEFIIMIMFFLNLMSIGNLSRTSQRYRKLRTQIEKKLHITWLDASHVHYQWRNECFTFTQTSSRFRKLYHYDTDGIMYEYSSNTDTNHQITLFVYRTKVPYVTIYDHTGNLVEGIDQRSKKQLALSVIDYFTSDKFIVPNIFCLM